MIGVAVGRVGRVGQQAARAGFNPAAIFLSASRGFLFDSNLVRMGASVGGAGGVSALGQSVAFITNMAPNVANHFIQPTVLNQPVIAGYTDASGRSRLGLRYLGDAFLASQVSMDMSGSDKISVIVGLRKEDDATLGAAVALGNISTMAGAGAIEISAPAAPNAAGYRAAARGASALSSATVSSGYPAPNLAVIGLRADLSANLVELWINGTRVAFSNTTTGGGNFANAIVQLGRRVGNASISLKGFLPCGMGINRWLPDNDFLAQMNWAKSEIGV